MERQKYCCSMPRKPPASLGLKADPDWAVVSENIPILQLNGITREHAKYNGEGIKQADANLLAYPLKLITDPGPGEKRPGLLSDKGSQSGHPRHDAGHFRLIICTFRPGRYCFSLFSKTPMSLI